MQSRIFCARTIITIAGPAIQDGSIAVENGRILDVGNKSELLKKHQNLEVVNLGNRIIMPGLVNAHTHISLSDAAEANNGKQFPEWLIDLIEYRKPLNRSDIVQSSRNGLKELLRMGTTTIGDSNPDLIPLEVALENDFHGVFFFEVFGLTAPSQMIKIWQYKMNLNKGRKINTNVSRLGISPHTVYTVTPSVMRFASRYAQKFNLQVSMHVSENHGELEFLKSRKGKYREFFSPFERRIPTVNKTPLIYADSFNLINQRFLCAHGVHLTDEEFQLLSKRGGSLVSCPSSNRNLESGHLDIDKPLDAGVNLCVGTDSPASCDSYDLFNELRLALKTGEKDEVKIDPLKALAMITINPAKAIGFDKEIGTIESGKYADLIAIEPNDNFDFANDDAHNYIIRRISGENIVLTVAAGKVRYSRISEIPLEKDILLIK